MIKLFDSNITDILPEFLTQKPEVIALGYALNKAVQRLLGYCQNIGIYNSIDTLPEQVLDLLALELKTQYYDDTFSIEIKRSLIKNALNWYMYAGTAAAATELVTAIFGDGEIEEWFDYGGEPYHFRIHTFNVETTDEMIRLAESLVKSVQNVRSQIEEVIIEIIESMTLYMGCKAIIDDEVTLHCDATFMDVYVVNELGEQLVNENGERLYKTFIG